MHRIVAPAVVRRTSHHCQEAPSSIPCLSAILIADHRALLDFFPDPAPLQSEHHLSRTFKETLAFFPAHAASAMLQADELLIHFPAAIRADLVAVSLFLRGGWHRFLLGGVCSVSVMRSAVIRSSKRGSFNKNTRCTSS